ncbi:uncharacterized protein LOC143024915 isoform X2 [Oratosquilla oratoria]|uniref:uncharacterized protein LOC143024915 isoform X2 n=1 Tax=Oratosquilla oratoria TaxID=337810 RepID=UPI003F76DB34
MAPSSALTREALTSALCAHHGPKAELVAWWESPLCKKGDNFVSELLSVCVEYKLQGVQLYENYVAKTAPTTSSTEFIDFTHTCLYREGLAYRDLVPELRAVLKACGGGHLAIPFCYHINIDKGSEILILENLHSQGFCLRKASEGLDVAHASLVMQELGRFHAAAALLQQRQPEVCLKSKYPFLEETWMQDTNFMAVIKGSIDGMISMIKERELKAEMVTWLQDFVNNPVTFLMGHLTTAVPPLALLNHGDCWNNNLLFRYGDDGAPVAVRMLDLAVIRLASPGCDITYFTFTSLMGPVRQQHLEYLLDTYYQVFISLVGRNGGQVPFSRKELTSIYRDRLGYQHDCTVTTVFSKSAKTTGAFSNTVCCQIQNFKQDTMQKFEAASFESARGDEPCTRELC